MHVSLKARLIVIGLLVAIIPITAAQDRPPTLTSAPERSIQEFRDPTTGFAATDLVRRALAGNTELAAWRLEVDRLRGRLRQARLLPNPVLDLEQTTGRWTGSPDERDRSIGVSVPIELGGKRGSRIDLARAELTAAEAEVSERERRLTAEVRMVIADGLASLRELEIADEFGRIDQQTVQFLQTRVNEGDAPPLELNLLRTEVDRMRARRALAIGKLESAILKVKALSGIPATDVIRFRETLGGATIPDPPPLATALETALSNRPDLRLARLNEEVANAGLKLARGQVFPDLVLSARYTTGTAVFDQTPVGALTDRDKTVTIGASINIPIFNRNQGATLEAQASIAQARRRREFVESMVRAEVGAAYSRYLAAQAAIAIFEPGVIGRSEQNILAVRGAYEIGAFRVTELLAEQRRLADFQREYTDVLAERYRALADLQAAMGTINP
jgi:cobalt-zinc-cadmium efflux system outer membrane protein